MKDPLRGVVVWAVPENKEVSVTLFKDARTQVMEDKEWTFAIEDVRRNFTVLLVLCMSIKFFFGPMPPHVLVDFVVLPHGHGRILTDF